MATISTANDGNLVSNDSMAQRVPGGAPGLTHVSDDELLAHTRRLVGKSNQLLAALREPLHLLHLRASLFGRCGRPPLGCREICEGVSGLTRRGRGRRAAP